MTTYFMTATLNLFQDFREVNSQLSHTKESTFGSFPLQTFQYLVKSLIKESILFRPLQALKLSVPFFSIKSDYFHFWLLFFFLFQQLTT